MREVHLTFFYSKIIREIYMTYISKNICLMRKKESMITNKKKKSLGIYLQMPNAFTTPCCQGKF